MLWTQRSLYIIGVRNRFVIKGNHYITDQQTSFVGRPFRFDGQDYYLFNSILQYRPRVVMIEFDRNADENFIPALGCPGQAGSMAIQKLAAGKFYDLVYSNICNAVFVRNRLARQLKFSRQEILEREDL